VVRGFRRIIKTQGPELAEVVLHKRIGDPAAYRIDRYMETGGYEALKKALLEMSPEQIVEEIKRSGLRGRGGAGFPTGTKWGFLPPDTRPRYLVVNADEGEPGTFKDRQLIEQDPHQLIEGIVISCYALDVHWAAIYVRGEMLLGAYMLQRAIEEAKERGFVGEKILGTDFSLDIVVHRGAGSYICGEETALLSSLEGRRGEPRLRPPFPAVEGLYRKPTIVNNVETLSNVPHIVLKGADWYASLGTEKSKGTRIFCLSGHVNRPGNYEVELGTTFRQLIFEYGKGIRAGNELKCFIPGGASAPWFGPDKLDVPLDMDVVMAEGSMLGSGAVVVMDETTCAVRAAMRLVRFFAHESCGQCTPCREGCTWMYNVLRRIEYGAGRPEDLDLLLEIGAGISPSIKNPPPTGPAEFAVYTTICLLGPSGVVPVTSALRLFREEFETHIEEGRCPKGTKRFVATVPASDPSP
jgi:NADH-quinone oxidoreductase subunit F